MQNFAHPTHSIFNHKSKIVLGPITHHTYPITNVNLSFAKPPSNPTINSTFKEKSFNKYDN
jgi:hypothetical protein